MTAWTAMGFYKIKTFLFTREIFARIMLMVLGPLSLTMETTMLANGFKGKCKEQAAMSPQKVKNSQVSGKETT